MNTNLFECLLQGVIRQFRVAFSNKNQRSWAVILDDSGCMSDCAEWWPHEMADAEINGFSIKIDNSGDDPWAIIKSCGKEFRVEISGKRIGMYGCTPSMGDSEMVDWFNDTMSEIGWGV